MEHLSNFNYLPYRGKAGIYRFYNRVTKRSYIGQSINLGLRISVHLMHARKGDINQVIYKAFHKHGIENFDIEILTVLPKHENLKKNLDLCEKVYIDFYDSYKHGYNSTLGGDGGILGYRMSEEEKLKRSLIQKGKKKNPLIINHKAKTVYLYNYITNVFITASSSFDASEMATIYGYNIKPGPIQDCARGVKKRSGNFICAYNLEELKNKIIIFQNGSKNKKVV